MKTCRWQAKSVKPEKNLCSGVLKKIIDKTASNDWKILEEIIKESLQEGICKVARRQITASVNLLKIEDVNFAMQ